MINQLFRMLGAGSILYPHHTQAKYPHIVEKIGILWGTAGMARYFSEVLFDDRGDREGFPAEVMTELFALSNYHETTRPSRTALVTGWQSSDLDRLDRFGEKH